MVHAIILYPLYSIRAVGIVAVLGEGHSRGVDSTVHGVVIGPSSIDVGSGIGIVVRLDIWCNLCPGIEVWLAYPWGRVCEGLRRGRTSEEQGEDGEPYN